MTTPERPTLCDDPELIDPDELDVEIDTTDEDDNLDERAIDSTEWNEEDEANESLTD